LVLFEGGEREREKREKRERKREKERARNRPTGGQNMQIFKGKS